MPSAAPSGPRAVRETVAGVDAGRTVAGGRWWAVLADYYELTKPRIITLLITTLAAMIMAARGLPPLGLTVLTLIGGALAAGSGGAFNCVIDRDIDRADAPHDGARPLADRPHQHAAGALRLRRSESRRSSCCTRS